MSEVITDTHGIALPSRYVVRRLDSSVRDWVIAMGIEGFMLRDASLWKPLLPFPKTANALRGLEKMAGHYQHSISSGFSFGIFDTQYVFSRPESAAARRMLHWRANDGLDPGRPEFETYGADQMRDAMDFPLVCIALAFDAFAARDPRATRDMLDLIPLQQQLGAFLGSVSENHGTQKGKGNAPGMEPTDFGQVLIRSGCVTRVGYERQGLATALNRFVMLEAKAWGFRGIKVGMGSESMLRGYMNPPEGCRSEVVAQWDFEDIEMEDEDGNIVRPYVGSGMKEGWEVWCDLLAEGSSEV
ncbi:hypothetical protein F5Y19DRAFT_12965 [Xylariaceae sp. FL1651]|nr:hypothetical protein F5Y19DRAFT_12965 [Xylariaceae sp. FL1651]